MDKIWNDAELYKLPDLQKHLYDVNFDLSGTKYEFLERIGTGAYGVVCRAQNVNNRQDYAIKKIKNPFNHKISLVRTLREIRILNHFNHKNIINVIDIFTKDSNGVTDVYVVFDLMESDLHKIITSKQFLSDDHIRYFMYQILCGVNYIHSASVIHRDLKPANILVNSNCHLKIADFGMARSLAASMNYDAKFSVNSANLNMTQYVMTRWYRAPELLMGQLPYNTKIDLWSCGCILAELYLQKPIFRGDNMISQLKEIIKKMGTPSNDFRLKILPIVNSLINAEGKITPTSLNQLIPTAPKKVIDLLSHLLIYDPDQRWSAMQALRHIFFLKIKNPLKEEICKSVLDLSFELELNTIETLKDALLCDISSVSINEFPKTLHMENYSKWSDEKSLNSHSISYSCDIQTFNKSESPLSERTLSADSGKELGYSIAYFDTDKTVQVPIYTDTLSKNNKLKTVSQFTKNKLINSIRKPKNKSTKKVVTAAQRQKERKDRKLELKLKRNVKFLTKGNESKYQDQLSELDKSFLKKWEHLNNCNMTDGEISLPNYMNVKSEDFKICCEGTNLTNNMSTRSQNNEIDDMSAGLSALLLLDDVSDCGRNLINEKLLSNSERNEVSDDKSLNLSTDNFDLLIDFDIDSINLDLNLLESYSCELFKS